jgi:hypothetical protein
MNIIDHSILLLFRDDIDILVFFIKFLSNEGVDIVPPLMVFLHSTHPYCQSCFKRQWHALSSMIGI